ncbi:hypothetical protein QAD02_016622, partial [Eretmocerus hayati]
MASVHQMNGSATTNNRSGNTFCSGASSSSAYHHLITSKIEQTDDPTLIQGNNTTKIVIPQWKLDLIRRRKQAKLSSTTGGFHHHPPPDGGGVSNSDCSADGGGGLSSSSSSSLLPLLPASTSVVTEVPRRWQHQQKYKCIISRKTGYPANNSKEEEEKEEDKHPVDATMRLEQPHQVVVANNIHQDDITMQDGAAESDSSEELQYGPGIVHKLRTRYLSMTLREMNRSRPSVHCFRRAASLEDLLEPNNSSSPGVSPNTEKPPRYAKLRQNSTGQINNHNNSSSGNQYNQNAIITNAVKGLEQRYRNAARGNDSIKRARSVEALVRYASTGNNNSVDEQRLAGFKPENEHIVLVDRSSLKIDSRLQLSFGAEKPPVNKPKRIKPLLAETERPPPDLVKQTLRIFESSCVRKLKPKGEVALKVATFKTINDSIKAQQNSHHKKILVPKPPLQPKPFLNGNSKLSASPRKIVLTRKPTAELIERQSSLETVCHNDGVITEPIVQSVSSVVSKFQQIERSCSPSSSPEPSFNKVRFSPAPSPEPSLVKARAASLDVKSPVPTPVPSPRCTPPKVQSPASPKCEAAKPLSSPLVLKSATSSTPIPDKTEDSRQQVPLETPKLVYEQDKDDSSVELVTESAPEPSSQSSEVNEVSGHSENSSSPDTTVLIGSSFEDTTEIVDSPNKSVSKSALDNISKAGMTLQFSFSDSPSNKSYLPRSVSNSHDDTEDSFEEDSEVEASTEASTPVCTLNIQSYGSEPEIIPARPESPKQLERLETESFDEVICKEDIENKPIGAISSLGLIKSTTTTTFPQGNESKTIRSPRSELSSPPQKQIGIIRPLVSTKTQLPQQNLSNREIEKNLINRAKSIEQPTKVVVSLKSAEEIQPVKKSNSSGGLWDAKPWNQANNTMVFNFSNRKDVPDYIENDGLIIKRKRDKPRSGDSGTIEPNIDNVQLTDDSDTELAVDPPSPCDVSFCNDNVVINGRSNLSRTPRNHK